MNLFSESKYCWNYNWEKLYKRLGIFKQQKHLKTSQNVYRLARGNDSQYRVKGQMMLATTKLQHQSASWEPLALIHTFQTFYCCNFQKLWGKKNSTTIVMEQCQKVFQCPFSSKNHFQRNISDGMISSKIELVVPATIKPNHLNFDCEKNWS